jgi:hypothetical protein
MSLLGATILTAIATLALAVFAFITAIFAWLAFRRQSQEVGLLLEQNKRDTHDRHRAQASRVFLAVDHDEARHVSPYARNASDLPVYDAWIRYPGPGSGRPQSEDLGTIVPGGTVSAARLFSYTDLDLMSAALMFRDAAGVHWARWPNGILAEIGSQYPTDSDLEALRHRLQDMMFTRPQKPKPKQAPPRPHHSQGPRV